MAITRTAKTVPTASDNANLSHIQDALNGLNNVAANAVDMTDGKITALTATVGDGSGSGDAGDRSWILQVTDTVKKILKWKQSTGKMRLEDEAGALIPLQVAEPTGSTEAATKNYTDTLVAATFPTGYRGSAPPLYASATTFTVAFLRDRNSADDGNIVKSTSTTVDITTTGLNGIAQSANLAGTITVTNATATVTGAGTAFTTDYVVGDVIRTNGGNARRITVITSNTAMTVESNWGATETGVAYRRGGRAPNTHYNLYSITNGTTTGAILSTRSVANGQTLVDLPSGYTKSRQQPFAARLEASSNIVPFSQAGLGGWVLYDGQTTRTTAAGVATVAASPYNLLNAGAATSFTSVSAASMVPPISRVAQIQGHQTGSADFYGSIRPGGSSDTVGRAFQAVAWNAPVANIALTSGQAFDYKRNYSTGTVHIDIIGWLPTEVF